MKDKPIVMSPTLSEVQDEMAMRVAKDDPDRPKDAWQVDEIASREAKERAPTAAAVEEKK